jgi:hypothetical protein
MKIIAVASALVLICTVVVEAAAKKQCRSSISGKIVSMKYAKAHPDTTQCAERK